LECNYEEKRLFGIHSHYLKYNKQTIIQWVQDPRQNEVYNINIVRRKALRHFRNKKKEYLKAKIVEHETNSKVKTIRDLYGDISDPKKGYQPRTSKGKE
jgi:beta-lactamase class D